MIVQGSTPLFAIILCTHNGERYIGEQLESIALQTYSTFVVFIHDWGSSDRTLEIVSEFAKAHPRMVVVQSHSAAPGPCESYLESLKLVPNPKSFDYFLFCDQDDFWVSCKLERLAETILETGADLITHDVEIVDSDLQEVHDSFYRASKYFNPPYAHNMSRIIANPVPGMSMCFSKQVAIAIIKLEMSVYSSIIMHDWLVLLIVISNEYKSVFINERLVKYRQHNSNIMGFGKRSVSDIVLHLPSYFGRVNGQYTSIEDHIGKRISSPYVLLNVLVDKSLTFRYRIFLIPVVVCIVLRRLAGRVYNLFDNSRN
jgi:rhamnosyltransferase